MKRFRFELGGSYIFYFGCTMGEAIQEFINHRPTRLSEITVISEEPIQEWER